MLILTEVMFNCGTSLKKKTTVTTIVSLLDLWNKGFGLFVNKRVRQTTTIAVFRNVILLV